MEREEGEDMQRTTSLPGIVIASFCVCVAFICDFAIPIHAQSQKTKDLPAHRQNELTETIQQQLIASEKASWDLAIKHDGPSYKALHAPGFFTVSGAGVSDRIHSEAAALDPNVSFDHCELSGFKVNFFGDDTAVITYRVHADRLDHGNKFDDTSYASALWRLSDGKWLNVFYQSTPAGK
jgi:hypothetical protein